MDLSSVCKASKLYTLINKLKKVHRINQVHTNTNYCGVAEKEQEEEEAEEEEEELIYGAGDEVRRNEFDFNQWGDYDYDSDEEAEGRADDARAAAIRQRDDEWDSFVLTSDEQARLLTVQSNILWLKTGKTPARYSNIKSVILNAKSPQYMTTLVFLIQAFVEESEIRWPQRCPVVVFSSIEPYVALRGSKSLRARLISAKAILRVIR